MTPAGTAIIPMVEHSSHTFYEDSARLYGRAVTGFALIWAAVGVFMFFAPLRWPGTSVALSIGVGIAILALTIPVFRFGRRLRRIALIARPDGVTILGPLKNYELAWDEIRAFTPGAATRVSAAGGEMPVVVAELTDGRRIVVHALRLDYGRSGRERAEAKIRHICKQIEYCRPRTAGPSSEPLQRDRAAGDEPLATDDLVEHVRRNR